MKVWAVTIIVLFGILASPAYGAGLREAMRKASDGRIAKTVTQPLKKFIATAAVAVTLATGGMLYQADEAFAAEINSVRIIDNDRSLITGGFDNRQRGEILNFEINWDQDVTGLTVADLQIALISDAHGGVIYHYDHATNTTNTNSMHLWGQNNFGTNIVSAPRIISMVGSRKFYTIKVRGPYDSRKRGIYPTGSVYVWVKQNAVNEGNDSIQIGPASVGKKVYYHYEKLPQGRVANGAQVMIGFWADRSASGFHAHELGTFDLNGNQIKWSVDFWDRAFHQITATAPAQGTGFFNIIIPNDATNEGNNRVLIRVDYGN